METGIFIRAEIDGKLIAVDIGDKRLPDDMLLEWLRSRGSHNQWAENCVFSLLEREQIAD